jgi:hypothetical protein
VGRERLDAGLFDASLPKQEDGLRGHSTIHERPASPVRGPEQRTRLVPTHGEPRVNNRPGAPVL